jgi:GT2 family glycosyltransferase
MSISSRDDVSICVIMLTLNQCEMTKECLSSLSSSDDLPFKILVWDNGSQDGTAEAVRERFPEVLVHYHPENLGVAPGRNAAAELAINALNPTYLLFLDNDMIVEPGFVRALLEPFAEDPQVGQTQAKLRFMDDRQRLNDGGGCQVNFWLGQTRPVGYGEIDRGQYDASRECVACGGAMMVRADVFQQLDGFDTTFGHLGPDDLDFSLRLSKAGYKALYVPKAVAYHKVSHTFGRDYNENYARLKTHNWFIFMRRHAPIPQILGFFLIGAPYLTVRLVIREGKKGNLGAVRGLARGMFDYLKSTVLAKG